VRSLVSDMEYRGTSGPECCKQLSYMCNCVWIIAVLARCPPLVESALDINQDQGWPWRWKAIHEGTMTKRCSVQQPGVRLVREELLAFKGVLQTLGGPQYHGSVVLSASKVLLIVRCRPKLRGCLLTPTSVCSPLTRS